MANRLATETSPYLLQHAENPVDWYPWGDEAFAAAAAAGKPIFISIGYAACHWCHVMAHESFESGEIAALMNELFINIKIDREERPDVDTVYMNAIHVMGEGGGWPLSAFCDEKGRPFYLGTYFPPTPRYGRPSFPEVLRTMSRVFADERDKVEQNALAVLEGLRHLDEHYRRGAVGRGLADLDESLLVSAGRTLAERTDRTYGGFGDKPKFPSSSAHHFLARAGARPFGGPAREAFLLAAEKMAAGGIYDHVGGGFARYSTDEKWLVPHFEKMLYDNAQLLAIYADAYAMTGEPAYSRVIVETTAWLEREMLDASGGLYASLDADSEGVEGKFYVWTPAEIKAALGAADAIFFCKAYGVTEAGNFEDGTTVLSRVLPPSGDAAEEALAAMREKLLAARADRVRPATDDKILAGWNALTVSGLLAAHRATGHAPALALAERVATFLRAEMINDSIVSRVFVAKDGTTKLEGTLDDYAFVALALIELSQVTGDPQPFAEAMGLLDQIVDRFYSEDADEVGAFYMTPSSEEGHLIHRPESHQDGAIPSGAAAAVYALIARARLTEDAAAMSIAERYLAGRAPQMTEHPYMGSRLLWALDLYLGGSELFISGGEGAEALLAAAHRAFAPNLIIGGPWASEALRAGKDSGPAGEARAFVCRGQVCSAPISTPDELSDALARHLGAAEPRRSPRE